MDDVSAMQRIETVQDLIQYVGTDTLWYLSLPLLDDWCKTPRIHELQEESEAWLVVVGIVAYNNVFIIFTFRHHCELIADKGVFFVIFRLHKF